MNMAAREDLSSVVHCLRAPVGGVFRHVRDLATARAKLGLNVGIICDETTGAEQATRELARIAQHCTLGVHRVPMQRKTDGLIFASDFSARKFVEKIGPIPVPYAVVHNGLGPGDFAALPAGSREFSFVFAGEIRKFKGLDRLLEAMVTLSHERSASLLVCGNGPDQHYLETWLNELGLKDAVTMTASVFPVTDAFAKAECVVIPSHAESLPYIVLEAASAAHFDQRWWHTGDFRTLRESPGSTWRYRSPDQGYAGCGGQPGRDPSHSFVSSHTRQGAFPDRFHGQGHSCLIFSGL